MCSVQESPNEFYSLDMSKWLCKVRELVFSAAFSNALPKKLQKKERKTHLGEMLATTRPKFLISLATSYLLSTLDPTTFQKFHSVTETDALHRPIFNTTEEFEIKETLLS